MSDRLITFIALTSALGANLFAYFNYKNSREHRMSTSEDRRVSNVRYSDCKNQVEDVKSSVDANSMSLSSYVKISSLNARLGVVDKKVIDLTVAHSNHDSAFESYHSEARVTNRSISALESRVKENEETLKNHVDLFDTVDTLKNRVASIGVNNNRNIANLTRDHDELIAKVQKHGEIVEESNVSVNGLAASVSTLSGYVDKTRDTISNLMAIVSGNSIAVEDLKSHVQNVEMCQSAFEEVDGRDDEESVDDTTSDAASWNGHTLVVDNTGRVLTPDIGSEEDPESSGTLSGSDVEDVEDETD